ncbi:serine hydrolase [Streptomyces sp. PTD5-9]|uniref:serine hydrolase n=1 Tax=Streptomyces sp. PTD5-9 TaxID=3120150 RepID=UPI003FCE89E1
MTVLTGAVMTTGALFPSAASAAKPDPVQNSLNTLVVDDQIPSASASVVDREGRTRHYTAGVGDLKTGAKVPKDGQVRAASNTKAFTAVVTLQLVAEKKIALPARTPLAHPTTSITSGWSGRRSSPASCGAELPATAPPGQRGAGPFPVETEATPSLRRKEAARRLPKELVG